MRDAKLTEAEFQELYRYRMQGVDGSDLPVVSREKARAFLLEMVRRIGRSVEHVQVTFDMDGKTLPPQRQATWEQDKAAARSRGVLLLAVVIDGETRTMEFPIRPYRLPEPMTRNLLESDWHEIAMLDATNSIKRFVRKKE